MNLHARIALSQCFSQKPKKSFGFFLWGGGGGDGKIQSPKHEAQNLIGMHRWFRVGSKMTGARSYKDAPQP